MFWGLRAPPPGLSHAILGGHKRGATVASRKHGGREGEMQSTYARALHTDLLYQFRRPGVAERASWPSPPAEHPASLSTADQDVHRGSSPSPITSDHARLPAAPKGAPLNRVRLAMEQHDVIASVWKLESAEVVMVDAVAGRGQLLPEGVCNLQFWDSLGRVYAEISRQSANNTVCGHIMRSCSV